MSILVVHRRPCNPAQGFLKAGDRVFPCALGSGGVTTLKREGDGATPRGTMRLVAGYWRPDGQITAARSTRLPLKRIHAGLGWCDRPGDRNYNRPVPLPYPASHERMLRDDRLYDVCVVLDWNLRPRRRGRGSAIFLHIARPGFAPTEGCVAVSPRVMAWLLPRLTPRTRLVVV